MMTMMMILLALTSSLLGGVVELPTGGVFSLYRGRWLCMAEEPSLVFGCCCFYCHFRCHHRFVTVPGLVCVVALLLADNGMCCWLVATAIMWHRFAVALVQYDGRCLPLSAGVVFGVCC